MKEFLDRQGLIKLLKKISEVLANLTKLATKESNGFMSKEDKDKLDNTNIFYGICDSDASDSTKIVNVEGNFKLIAGTIVHVKFSNTNTSIGASIREGLELYQTIYLNIAKTGNYSIKYNNNYIGLFSTQQNTTNVSDFNISHIAGVAGRIISYLFDGEFYHFIGWSYDHSNSYGVATTELNGLMSASDKVKLLGKEEKITIVKSYGEILNAAIEKYYRFDEEVNTLEVTLPNVEETDRLKSLVLSFTTGDSPFIMLTANNDIQYFQDYLIEHNTTYEINIMFNGTNWIVAYGVVE